MSHWYFALALSMPADNLESKKAFSPYLSLLYGGVAGSVAKTVIAPFDRVKIHFQIAHPELSQHRGNDLITQFVVYV